MIPAWLRRIPTRQIRKMDWNGAILCNKLEMGLTLLVTGCVLFAFSFPALIFLVISNEKVPTLKFREFVWPTREIFLLLHLGLILYFKSLQSARDSPAISLQLLEIDHFRCSWLGLGGWCRSRCLTCGGLLIRFAISLDGALLTLVRYSNVLTQAIFVLEGLLTVITFSRRLRGVLCANVTPEIHRGDD